MWTPLWRYDNVILRKEMKMYSAYLELEVLSFHWNLVFRFSKSRVNNLADLQPVINTPVFTLTATGREIRQVDAVLLLQRYEYLCGYMISDSPGNSCFSLKKKKGFSPSFCWDLQIRKVVFQDDKIKETRCHILNCIK